LCCLKTIGNKAFSYEFLLCRLQNGAVFYFRQMSEKVAFKKFVFAPILKSSPAPAGRRENLYSNTRRISVEKVILSADAPAAEIKNAGVKKT